MNGTDASDARQQCSPASTISRQSTLSPDIWIAYIGPRQVRPHRHCHAHQLRLVSHSTVRGTQRLGFGQAFCIFVPFALFRDAASLTRQTPSSPIAPSRCRERSTFTTFVGRPSSEIRATSISLEDMVT